MKGRCPVCEGYEPRTVNRLLVLGHGSRFVAERFPGLTRMDVRRHKEVCLPPVREEVNKDLKRLAGIEEEGGGVA